MVIDGCFTNKISHQLGLPLIAGFSVWSIPKAMNDSKPSRSFYEKDDDLSLSSIIAEPQQTIDDTPALETAAKQAKKPVEKEETVVTKYVDGFKINTSNFLEKHLHGVRSSIINNLNYADAEYRNLKSAACNEWTNLTSGLTSLYDPKDEFLPSFIYALTFMLSGSILVNRRSLPVRFITPIVFGIAGFKMFLPGTFCNTSRAIKNWEAKEHPDLLQGQRALKQSWIDAERAIEQTGAELNQGLINTVHDIRTSLVK